MSRFEKEPNPIKPIRGIDSPPSREFGVFRETLREVRKAVEGLNEPARHPVIGRLVEIFRHAPVDSEPPEDEVTDKTSD